MKVITYFLDRVSLLNSVKYRSDLGSPEAENTHKNGPSGSFQFVRSLSKTSPCDYFPDCLFPGAQSTRRARRTSPSFAGTCLSRGGNWVASKRKYLRPKSWTRTSSRTLTSSESTGTLSRSVIFTNRNATSWKFCGRGKLIATYGFT